MAAEHFMPLWVGDFLGATATWNGPEIGAYLLLLMVQWTAGSLPKEPQKLAMITRLKAREFRRVWPTVSQKFVEQEGRLINLRLEEVRRKNNEIQQSRSASASVAARAMWDAKRSASRMPDASDDPHASRTAPGTADTSASRMPSESDPIREKTKIRIKTKNRIARVEPAWLTSVRAVYPRRAGDQNWRGALRAGNARIAEGHTVEQFIAGAERYAAYLAATGKIGTEYVKQAATFLGPGRPFLELWAPPPKAATPMDRIRSANNTGGHEDERRASEQTVEGTAVVVETGGHVRR